MAARLGYQGPQLRQLGLGKASNSKVVTKPTKPTEKGGHDLKVVRLAISNFRGIKAAELHFDDHVLIIGPNNIGKSTVCEALDLVLGPDRASRFPPVEEFDFHNAQYVMPSVSEGEELTPIPIRTACGHQEGKRITSVKNPVGVGRHHPEWKNANGRFGDGITGTDE